MACGATGKVAVVICDLLAGSLCTVQLLSHTLLRALPLQEAAHVEQHNDGRCCLRKLPPGAAQVQVLMHAVQALSSTPASYCQKHLVLRGRLPGLPAELEALHPGLQL